MTQVTISLDQTSPIRKELQEEIIRYLDSLETAKYSQEIQPAEPGKLGGIEPETVKIIIELTSATINFLAAIITIVTQIQAAQDRDSKDERRSRHKYVEIEIGEDKISLPVTEQTARRFLNRVAEKVGEEHEVKKNPTKRQSLPSTPRKKRSNRNLE